MHSWCRRHAGCSLGYMGQQPPMQAHSRKYSQSWSVSPPSGAYGVHTDTVAMPRDACLPTPQRTGLVGRLACLLTWTAVARRPRAPSSSTSSVGERWEESGRRRSAWQVGGGAVEPWRGARERHRGSRDAYGTACGRVCSRRWVRVGGAARRGWAGAVRAWRCASAARAPAACRGGWRG